MGFDIDAAIAESATVGRTLEAFRSRCGAASTQVIDVVDILPSNRGLTGGLDALADLLEKVATTAVFVEAKRFDLDEEIAKQIGHGAFATWTSTTVAGKRLHSASTRVAIARTFSLLKKSREVDVDAVRTRLAVLTAMNGHLVYVRAAGSLAGISFWAKEDPSWRTETVMMIHDAVHKSEKEAKEGRSTVADALERPAARTSDDAAEGAPRRRPRIFGFMRKA